MKYWEFLKEIEEGNIKDGTKIKNVTNNVEYVYIDEMFLRSNNYDCCLDEDYCMSELVKMDFEIIEEKEEINIQNIEELEEKELITTFQVIEKTNEIIQALKQLDKKIKEDKQ